MNGVALEHKFDPETLPDGLYVTGADTAAYPVLMAMKLVGRALLCGIAFEPDGREIVTFKVGKTAKTEYKQGREVARNVRMQISQRWLQNAILDYTDWSEKWWREAIQNSADAKATKIRCYAYDTGSGWDVGCVDNGKGMTLEILLEKFLVMGGTTKEGGDETSGGFGKAKEMLILPWMSWRIHSRDNLAVGVGDSYSVYTAQGDSWVWYKQNGEGDRPDFPPPMGAASNLDGTHLWVRMPNDKHTTIAAACVFVEKCWLPKIEFEFETNSPEDRKVTNVQANLKNGRTVEEIGDKAKIHYTKASTLKPRILVRTREGLLMFEENLPYEVTGYVVVELLKPSIQLLSSNRDSISDYDLRARLREFTNHLARNTQSALAEQKNKFVEVYKGERFSARQQSEKEADLVSTIGKLAQGSPEKPAEINEQPKLMVGDILEQEYKRAESEAKPGEIVLKPGKESGEAMLDGKFTGPNQVAAAVKQLIWQPAFILYNEMSEFRVSSKFRPQGMTPTIMRLAKVWTELCRYVLMQLGCEREWGVGFGFSESFRAAYVKKDGIEWLVLNPLRTADNLEEIYNPSNEADLKFLYAMAIHECTHLNDNAPDHEETFTIALTKNIALCADGYRKIKKIASGIKLRGQAEFEKKKSLSIPDWQVEWNTQMTYNMRGILFDNWTVALWKMGEAYGSRTASEFLKSYRGSKPHVSFENYNGELKFQFHDEENTPPNWKHVVKYIIKESMDPGYFVPESVMRVYNQYDDILYRGPVGDFTKSLATPKKVQLQNIGEVNIDAEITAPAIGVLTVDEKGHAHAIWQDNTDDKSQLDDIDAATYAGENGLGIMKDGNVSRIFFLIRVGAQDKYLLSIWDDQIKQVPQATTDYYELRRYFKENPRAAIWVSGFMRALGEEYQRGLNTTIKVNGDPLWHGLGSDVGDAVGSVMQDVKKEG